MSVDLVDGNLRDSLVDNDLDFDVDYHNYLCGFTTESCSICEATRSKTRERVRKFRSKRKDVCNDL